MRIALIVVCFLVLSCVAACRADEAPRARPKSEAVVPAVWTALREASEIATKQPQHQQYWTDRVLLHIGDLQIQAGDFDGALRSIRASGDACGRNAGLVFLVHALARDGKRQRAFEISGLVDSDFVRHQELEEDRQLRWIDYLIAAGDFDRAAKAVEQLKFEDSRVDGRGKLAVAHAEARDAARAAKQFGRAVDAALLLTDDPDRAQALWETAVAQLAVGTIDAAKSTLRRLGQLDWKDSWAKFSALQAAELSAKAHDKQVAQRLSRRALEAQQTVDDSDKVDALHRIAVAQAAAGLIDDALKTTSTIHGQAAPREQALYAIAVAQLKANDAEGALRSALSVRYCLQYRDDAIHKIVDYHIARRDLKKALPVADKVDNSSRKAAAMLKVALAHARSGDRKTAAQVAARIELTPKDHLARILHARFDYRLPETWGINYDFSGFFTVPSYQMEVEHAVELATAAMTLAQALELRPAQSYAVLFKEVLPGEVVQALAHAHAVSGDPKEALAWARQIGSGGKVSSNDDQETQWAVEQRIHALLGVAEGILERSDPARPQPTP
jgi:hypothetical protein